MIPAAREAACRVRPGEPEDLPLMRRMLYEAVHWPREDGPKPPPDRLLARPGLARYLEGWGRPGDAAAVATDPAGQEIGAAWYRLMPSEAPGYGFVNAWTPELAMAVAAPHRGGGVGEALLRSLVETARSQGFGAISLSVQRANARAARLYRRCGFEEVSGSEEAATMRLDLQATASARRGSLALSALEERLCICRLDPDAEIPAWAENPGLVSIVRTPEELSIVCPEARVPRGIPADRGWRALRLEGPFDLSLTGVLVSVLDPLALARIPIFALSTFDTDYVLVPATRVPEAARVLAQSGHRVHLTYDKLTIDK